MPNATTPGAALQVAAPPMKITVKRTPESEPETVDVPDVHEFVLEFPFAQVESGGRWVSIEKVYPVTGF